MIGEGGRGDEAHVRPEPRPDLALCPFTVAYVPCGIVSDPLIWVWNYVALPSRIVPMQDRVVCKYTNEDGYEGPTEWIGKPVVQIGIKNRSVPPLMVTDPAGSEFPAGSVCVESVEGGKDVKSIPKVSARCWCFTQDCRDADTTLQILKGIAEGSQRMIVGKEVGAGGYVHFQGYARFRNVKSMKWWKAQLPRVHLTVARGSDSQNTVYCSKEGNVVIDHGVDCDVRVSGMHKDEEAAMVIGEVQKGATYGQVRQRHTVFAFWHRKNILDFMRDEQFLNQSPDEMPM